MNTISNQDLSKMLGTKNCRSCGKQLNEDGELITAKDESVFQGVSITCSKCGTIAYFSLYAGS